jgi:hypothetical protein
MEKTINEFVEEVAENVRENIIDVNDIQIKEFKKYLTDAVTREIIANGRHVVRVMGTSDKITPILKSSLIASTIINADSNLEEDEKIDYIELQHDRNTLFEAKKYVINTETDYLDGIEFGKRACMLYAKVKAHDELTDPIDLVKIGVTYQDRMSAYNEGHPKNENIYLEIAMEAWKMEKQKYINNGLTNKPYYKILEDIYENNDQHHYSLVTRKALENIASFTYKLDNDLTVTVSELQDMYRYNSASKEIESNVALKYNEPIKEVMREYTAKHKGNAKTK